MATTMGESDGLIPERRVLPPQLLVLGGVASVQFGSAFADTLFDRLGPGGTVFLRVGFGALLLVGIARPRIRGRSRRDWLSAVGFGIVLAGMNWSFYESLERTPLGIAVTIEFVGPLAVAVAGSRKLLDLVWGRDTYVEPRTVDVHVRRLRTRVERDDRKPELILTVRGVGYKFNDAALDT